MLHRVPGQDSTAIDLQIHLFILQSSVIMVLVCCCGLICTGSYAPYHPIHLKNQTCANCSISSQWTPRNGKGDQYQLVAARRPVRRPVRHPAVGDQDGSLVLRGRHIDGRVFREEVRGLDMQLMDFDRPVGFLSVWRTSDRVRVGGVLGKAKRGEQRKTYMTGQSSTRGL